MILFCLSKEDRLSQSCMILIANKDYYSHSCHIYVWKKCSICYGSLLHSISEVVEDIIFKIKHEIFNFSVWISHHLSNDNERHVLVQSILRIFQYCQLFVRTRSQAEILLDCLWDTKLFLTQYHMLNVVLFFIDSVLC